ncbi:signal peptide peptidase SppA [Pelagibius litoralis]|uniref:Signal peptide peptidase SppA n=1 Tax=Pelagibius litoralis TaxID=374515 RepID=A0A967EZA8_9PROT|nr:signal peptide peptidase SppA [Pelagibius litoralis]NIA70134.1 signal peptide peptidase SppA [Pelagibius litoralis]
MTRIILFILKCFVGIFATVGFLAAAGIIAGALLLQRFDGWLPQVAELPEESVLVLDMADGLIEQRPDNPLGRVSLGSALILRDAVGSLHAASRDERVKGLVIRAGWGSPGLAQVQELRDAIADFRAQGKPVTAFAETFGEAGNGTLHYYLASAAGEIWVQPSGDIDITGFALQQPFLRQLLEEYGVRAQVGQREEYKGAMAIFTETRLPEPQRQNLQRYLDSTLSQIVTAIAESRNLETGAVRNLVDTAPHRGADALRLGLIDKLGYWDQVSNAVEVAAGPEAELLSLRDYARATAGEADEDADDGTVIALVHGAGPIVLDQGENDPIFGKVSMGAVDVVDALSTAIDDEDVAAILFRVDSPGGSYVASDTIWREVQRARDLGKPVVVSMGDVAGSGGYFVAAPAHSIVAQPGTLTGSIGVITGKFALNDLWRDLGVNWDGVQAGRRANMWSPNAAFSREEWEWLQANLDTTYADFTDKVASGRNLSREEVLAVAGGRIWSGEDALAAGLVDELGGYRKALSVAKEAAGIPEDAVVQLRAYPEERDPFSALFEDAIGGEIENPAILSMVRGLARLAQALAPLVGALESLTADPRTQTLHTGPIPASARP